VQNLVSTPLARCGYKCVDEESSSLCFSCAFPNPLDHSHVSPTCSLPSPSPEYYMDALIDYPMIFNANNDLGYQDNEFNMLSEDVHDYASLGCFRGYDPSIDPYCICLEDLPKKIMGTTFFNPFYEFSMGLDRVKRILNFFDVILVISSYLVFFELWS